LQAERSPATLHTLWRSVRGNAPARLIHAALEINEEHKLWPLRAVCALLDRHDGTLDGHAIGVWGLVYTARTDTLRRSNSVELCGEVAGAGATVRAHDTAIGALPAELAGVLALCDTRLKAAVDASAVVVETNGRNTARSMRKAW
jgi:UDPglucose 6-dehydrogenase